MFAFGGNSPSVGNISTPKGISRQNLPLTPRRIPKFTIPPKLSLSPRVYLKLDKDEDTQELLSSESPEKQSPRHLPSIASPFISAKLRFTPKTKRLQRTAMDDLSDPSTRAAMSLEHVGKVTTPYGFRTLAASPNVSRRESLFHKRGRCAEQKVTVDSEVLPSSKSTFCNTTKKNCSDKTFQESPSEHQSHRKSKRPGLELLFNKPLAVLKTLTPKRKNSPIKLKF
ncbi:putative C2 calcium-dependent domain-containing protein 4C-like [Triplophysa rosa]|uniref:C2 calcium-dependent domain-containing protein 4C-like n=1 Tax=Triplophysa rosa TaxID=992332 RepID=A0A9W7TKQ6_TRIRA|nr:putative C2 calcium-dependent domain-containing protein 4C-like [Triplophysa rosa]